MVKLKDNGYTEEEKNELFAKLRKIGDLFGLKIKVTEEYGENEACAKIGDNEIGLSLSWSNTTSFTTRANRLTELMWENIDSKHNIDIRELPCILFNYLHEIAHTLTMSYSDCVEYHSDKYLKYRGDNISYRKHPYEKLADNLGYELLCDNYNQIIKVLLGKRIRVDNRKVVKNINTAKCFKQNYILQ